MNNTTIGIDFPHAQSAHCESGVVSNLLRFNGHSISEAMAFGIGAGIFFAHMPFVKVNDIPGTSYRVWPGQIFKRVSSRLGAKMYVNSFRSPEKAKAELDAALDKGIPTGMLTSVYYLPYLPKAYRFRFNAHNIVVFGREGNTYFVSDPVMDYTTEIEYGDLEKARFAKGFPEPKGKLYYPLELPAQIDLKKPVTEGIKQASYYMTKLPLPMFGVKGIRFLAKRLGKYPDTLGERKAGLYLGNIIRMQEEIGTGGAGFRFLYAAFLQESSQLLQQDWLSKMSQDLTTTGDVWRNFAYHAGRICKSRVSEGISYPELADMLMDCAEREEKIFKRLGQIR